MIAVQRDICLSIARTSASIWSVKRAVSCSSAVALAWRLCGVPPPHPEIRPLRFNRREALAHPCIPRHEQRAMRIADPQQLDAGIELRYVLPQQRRIAGVHGTRHAVDLHAQATRLIDRGRATIELPRHPEGHSDRDPREDQKRQQHQRELQPETPLTLVRVHHGVCFFSQELSSTRRRSAADPSGFPADRHDRGIMPAMGCWTRAAPSILPAVRLPEAGIPASMTDQDTPCSRRHALRVPPTPTTCSPC
jgi:hypothetical protein